MKKLIFLLALATALVACEKNEPKAFKINATDMIAIKPAVKSTAMKMKADAPVHLSALEIVKQVSSIQFMRDGVRWGRSFTKAQRDTISTTPKLLMWATDVISLDGNLQPDFLEATDVIFLVYENITAVHPTDTIAYIPNSVLRNAEAAIRAAYAAQDIEACYALFNDAYTFVPITGAEWKALKEAGQN